MVYLGLILAAVFVVSLVFILYKFLNDTENNWDVCITLDPVELAATVEVEDPKKGVNEIDDLMVTVKRKLMDAEKLSDQGVTVEVMEEVKTYLEKMEKLMRLGIQRAERIQREEHIKSESCLDKSNVISFPSYK